jgi:hypothetical protein
MKPGKAHGAGGLNDHPLPLGGFSGIWGWFPLLIFMLSLQLFSSNPLAWSDFPLDDAWIHRVYSQAFAHGQGFAYNPGSPETGATSPLWTILTAPAHWFGGPDSPRPALVVKGIGILLALAAIRFVWRLAFHLSRSPGIACLAGVLFAVEPRLALAALSGMEPILSLVLWLWASSALMRGHWHTAALLISLLPVTRPEWLAFLPLFAVVFLISCPTWRKLTTPVLLIVPLALWMYWCHSVSGALLPATFYLKTTWFFHGLDTIPVLWRTLQGPGWLSLPLGLVGALAFLRFCHHTPTGKTALPIFCLGFVPGLYLISVICTRKMVPEFYYWSRWADPATLVWSSAWCLGYAHLLLSCRPAPLTPASAAANRPPAAPRSLRLALLLLAPLALLLSTPQFIQKHNHYSQSLADDSRAIHRLNVAAGLWINRHTPPQAVIGANDAGAIRYFGQRRTLDLMGLNFQNLAFGRLSRPQVLAACDWLAIFPHWFQQHEILPHFEYAHEIAISPAEYTPARMSGPPVIALFSRRSSHFLK